MPEPLKIGGLVLALCACAFAVDFGCYYQATIFTTLDGSGKGMDANFRDPPYHPFVHPILWMLMAIALAPIFLLVAFNVGGELSAWITAVAGGAFFLARYILMRRGIS